MSKRDIAELERAVRALDSDLTFQADVIKSQFLEQVLEAMGMNGQSQSQVAAEWGRSRQYVSKVFNEDRRVNFTIETMTELAAVVRRRLRLELGSLDAEVEEFPSPAQNIIRMPVWSAERGMSKNPGTDMSALFNNYIPIPSSEKTHFSILHEPRVAA